MLVHAERKKIQNISRISKKKKKVVPLAPSGSDDGVLRRRGECPV